MISVPLIQQKSTGVLVHTCNPCTQKVEAGKSRARCQPGIVYETLAKEKKKSSNEVITPQASGGCKQQICKHSMKMISSVSEETIPRHTLTHVHVNTCIHHM